jgi:transcriptional regulator with XRE-family HTH domain
MTQLQRPNRLGEYLHVRRGLVDPTDVGFVDHGRRRVPGLRREELALLAGISVDYYVRVEQGRQHPSERVVDALATALRLDPYARDYLRQLAHPGMRSSPLTSALPVSAGLTRLLESSTETPALVLSRLRDVLILNPLAAALLPILRPGENQLRALFSDPRAQALYADWASATSSAVAALRAAVAPDFDDPELTALVDELSSESARFAELWGRHDAGIRPGATAKFNHPSVGQLELRFDLLSLMGTDGQVLVIYFPDPETASERAITQLRAQLMSAEDSNALQAQTSFG